MKNKIIYIFLSICLASINVYGQTYFDKPRNDSDEARFWAKQLLDSEVLIGVFEDPFPEQGIRKLKSGIMPQTITDYIDIMVGQSLIKLWQQGMIKGTTDSIIYIQAPMLSVDENKLLQFESSPGSSWILCLKPCIKNGKKDSWTQNIKSKSSVNFVNQYTAFDIVDIYQGNLLIKSNPSVTYNPGVMKGNVNQLKEILTIYQFIKANNIKKTNSDYVDKSQQLATIPTNTFAKLIVRMLLEKL